MVKSFKQYLLESVPTGNYVSLDADDPLLDISVNSGVLVPRGKHHVTLMYSESTSVPEEIIRKTVEWMTGNMSVQSSEADSFDSQEDDSLACVVLKIKSSHLYNIHNELTNLGLVHSYDEFSPHVTLAYNVKKEEAKKIVDSLNEQLRDTPTVIILHGLTVAPIIKNWSDAL